MFLFWESNIGVLNFFEKMPSSLQAPKLIVERVHAIVNLVNMCELIKSIEFETTLLIFSFICGYWNYDFE